MVEKSIQIVPIYYIYVETISIGIDKKRTHIHICESPSGCGGGAN